MVSLPALVLALGLSEEGLPELPRLPLADYPPGLRGRIEEALDRAEREPRSAAAAGELGMLLHAYDQHASAEAAYARARALDPAAFEWTYLAGLAQMQLGRTAAAVDSLRAAVARRPRSLAARLRLGDALLAAGDARAAAALYEGVLEDHPDAPQAHYGLGRAAAARGLLEAAVERYQAACRLFEAYAAAHYALGLAYRDLGRSEDARRHLALYDRDRMAGPPLEDPVLERVRRLKAGPRERLAEGVRLGKAGDVLGSIREHEKSLEEDPTLAQAHANLISLYGRLGRWEKAEEHYRAAVALNPGLADVHYDQGVALTQQGRAREAAEAFRKALEINPYHARAHNNLGTLLFGESRFEEAAGHFRDALENDPGFRLAGFNLGRALVAQGRLREAIEEFRKILTPEDEETPRYLYALGAAYVRAGDREKGVRYSREAREKAEALGQAELAATIDRDLRRLEAGPRP